MKKFSKLLAVLVALAVIICPMTSAIVANATTSGSYSIVAEDANNVVLTIHADDGFVVYQATVTFDSASSFVNNYSSDGYTNGLKVVDYTMVDAAKDAYNAPAISAQQNGASLVLLVSATNGANMDLYKEIKVGIRVASGSTANLANIQAADDGEVTEDPTLLNFGSKVNASTGNVDIENDPNATTGESHTHNFQMTNTVVATPATCNTPVQYYKVCSVCGATGDTYAGDTYADHTPSVQARDAAHLASAATCTADATYYYGCAVCGTVVKSDKQGYTGTWTDTGTATNHANKVYHAASAATCTATGNTAYYSCPDCGKYFSDAACTIEIANNSWVTEMTSHTASNTETYLKTAATCTDNAIYFQTCSVCGAKLDTTWVKAATATGHSFTSYTYNDDATCTAAGTETATCANGCGTTDTRTSAEHPALGHDWVAGTVTAPTCTEAGNTHYTCSRCDATKDEAIAATGHTEETIPAVAATCTTAGSTAGVKCSVCDAVLTAPTPIAALGHNMTAHTANAATCTAAGNSAYWSCDRCNKFFSDSEGNTEIAENSWIISATGHTPVTDPAVAATCVATGLTEGSHCSVCSAVLTAQEETPIDPTNHANVVEDAAVAATCTETGLTAGSHCAACSTVIVAQTVVPANGHSYIYTDNGDGTHDVSCANCDYELNDQPCVDEDPEDEVCDLCGAEIIPEGPSGPTTDSAITFKDAAVSIGASLQIRFRWTKSTISASYDHYDCVVVPTKYDTSGSNAYNKYQASPIVMADESTGGTSSIYWYRDVAMYELGLSMDCYIRCYNAKNEIVAVSNAQTITPSDMLKTTYASANTSLKTVITDLLNMAGSAQRYFAANNTASDLFSDVQENGYVNTEFDQTYATSDYGTYSSVNSIVWESDSPLNSSTYAFSIDLIADKSPTIKYSVKRLANLEASDVRLVVTYTSNNPSAAPYSRTFTGSDMTVTGTKRELRMADVAYYDADVTVTAQLYYQDQLCCTAQYSVTTGIMAALPLTQGNQHAMFDAIAKFGISARRFTGFGSQS